MGSHCSVEYAWSNEIFQPKVLQIVPPLTAAGPHFDPKKSGVVWSTDTKMNLNVAKCAAKGPETAPEHTGNHVCMTCSCPEPKFSAGPRRRLALLIGVFLVQRDFSTISAPNGAPWRLRDPILIQKKSGVAWSTDTKMHLNASKCAAKGPKSPPQHTGNHVCMNFSCPEPKLRAGPHRRLALLIGVFLVQRDLSTKSAQNRVPWAAGSHFPSETSL